MAQFTAKQFLSAIQDVEQDILKSDQLIERVKQLLEGALGEHGQKMAGAREAKDKPRMAQIRKDIKEDQEITKGLIEKLKEEKRESKRELRQLRREMRKARKRSLL